MTMRLDELIRSTLPEGKRIAEEAPGGFATVAAAEAHLKAQGFALVHSDTSGIQVFEHAERKEGRYLRPPTGSSPARIEETVFRGLTPLG